MESIITEHNESINLSKADLDIILRDYCKEFMPLDGSMKSESIIPYGAKNAIRGVSYIADYEHNTPDGVKIKKQIILDFSNDVVFGIIKENSIKKLGLPGMNINWNMIDASWDWKNGAHDLDIILFFKLKFNGTGV